MSRPGDDFGFAEFQDAIDAYLDGTLDAAGLEQLEQALRADPVARRHFVRYCRLHTDLVFSARAARATARAVQSVGGPSRGSARRLRLASAAMAVAACGLLSLAAFAWMRRPPVEGPSRPAAGAGIAWLLNAQDCEWAERLSPGGDMRPGQVLRIEHGLAEVGFQCGARVVLEGPASLELLTGARARLLRGKAAAKVPEAARGFTILSPTGQVVDLGTEFAMSVDDRGRTEVLVFEGQVVASSARPPESEASSITLRQRESAVLESSGLLTRPGSPAVSPGQFVRGIVPPARRAPRTVRLDFSQPCDSDIRTGDGLGTGLTHRLPGTGTGLEANDRNIHLNHAAGQLELTTTNSDINRQFQLDHGEYLGMLLSDLGFTGSEDFSVTVSLPEIPKLELVGQFGLFAGTRSHQVIRGGLISLEAADRYSQFLVNNDGGIDSDLNQVGLVSTGDDLRITLRRESGSYSLMVENRTTGSSSTLRIRHPGYLDGERELVVGIFGANTQSNLQRTLVVQELEVTVWAQEK